MTRQYVDAIAGLSPNPKGCAVLDTRKTLPGLRQAQKYAVRTGGGQNQRLALWHGILIKENHIAAAGGIAAALQAALALNSGVMVQIEVESLAELEVALAAGAQNVLLDDFTLADMHSANALNAAGRAVLEVSGGVDLALATAAAPCRAPASSLRKALLTATHGRGPDTFGSSESSSSSRDSVVDLTSRRARRNPSATRLCRATKHIFPPPPTFHCWRCARRRRRRSLSSMSPAAHGRDPVGLN